MSTIQCMVSDVDKKLSGIQAEMHEMKHEILEMKGNIQSSKFEVEIVNSINDKLKQFDHISGMKKKVEMTIDNVKNEVLKIVATQNTLSSSLKDVVRNLPQRDEMMDKHELSQSLADIKQSVHRNKPLDNTEIIADLKKVKDITEKLPKQGQIMTKTEMEGHFNDIKDKMTKNQESQGATGGW